LHGQDGFTLNEILISVALIAIGILGFSLNTMGVIQGSFISANYTVAANLAQAKMEQLKTQSSFTNVDTYDSAGYPTCTGSGASADNNITAIGGTGGTYDRCWRITDSSFGSGLKQVNVTVSWRDYASRSVVVSTLVYTG
jgi:prepilin-type N-terminal cleavage/methylation domain-containing protein